jgi:transposase
MARIYSTDLRDRVLAFIRSGHSRRAAARHFAVSPSFAVKLAARERRTGSSAPDRRGRRTGHGKLAPVMGFLITRLQAEPDITMPELVEALQAAHEVTVHPASLSRALCKAGFTYKKIAAGPGVRTRKSSA